MTSIVSLVAIAGLDALGLLDDGDVPGLEAHLDGAVEAGRFELVQQLNKITHRLAVAGA